MLSTGLFEMRATRLLAILLTTLVGMTASLLLAPGVAHAYEVHISITGAGQVIETTSADLVGEDCVTSSTNPTGAVGKDCFPGDPNGEYGIGWDVDYLAIPKPGYRFDQWQSDGSPKPVICDRSSPPATTSTYTGTACKFRTFDNLQTRAVFVDDTSPTMASLSGPNGAVNGAATFTFSASSDPTLRFFECRVAGVHDWQTCSSGRTEDPPSSGTYTFEVRAVDWSNNRSSTMSRNWTVDKTPPNVSINGFPPPFSNSSSATFTFTSSEANSTFQCSRDGASFSSCTSSNSQSYAGLSDGQHTFAVRATDSLGNVGNPATRTWTVDTVAPNTTLDPSVGPAPDIATQDNDPNFAFFSNDAQVTFECNLTGPGLTSAAFSACSSPKGYTNLKDGTYTFKVRAKDQATNADASPAERTWTINNTPTVLENSLAPIKLATGVSRTTMVSASFSEEMAPTSIANLTTHVSRTFKLQMYNKKKKKWVAIPARVEVSNNTTTATLDPYGLTEGATEKPLGANKKFRATLTTGVTDADGNPLAKSFVWTFKTGSS